MRLKNIMLVFVIFGMIFLACNNKEEEKAEKKKEERISFVALKGIKYYEVKRRFSNGLSFHKGGFQLEPSWIIEFLSNDSASAWSPQMNRWHQFPILFDHDSVYNFAHEYFRIKKATKDSLTMQRLEVKSMAISLNERSDVNMTFYSSYYIFNTLKSTPEALQRPTSKDSLFIRQLAYNSNKAPSSIEKAFGARKPVQFIPISTSVTIDKIVEKIDFRETDIAKRYLYPEYTLRINNAYKNFAIDFSAVVDAWGNIYVKNVKGVLPEFVDSKIKVAQGISDVYLKNLYRIVPGSTLGMVHSSEVNLYVVGKTGK